METPSSARGVTRSQALLASAENKKKQEASSAEKPPSSRLRNHPKPDRSVLLDITNDSPVVGLAVGSFKTPSSTTAKNKIAGDKQAATPGSGEALLRRQVKTLLQKVEEGAEFVKLSSDVVRPSPFQGLLSLLRSPTVLLAPTPANTPDVAGLVGYKEEFKPVMQPVQEEDRPKLPQMVDEDPKEEEEAAQETGECQINRALLFDSPVKSEVSDSSSVLTFQGSRSSNVERSSEGDDCSSAWSIQVNASSEEEEEGEGFTEYLEEEYDDEEDEWCEEEWQEGDELGGLCEGLKNLTVQEKTTMSSSDFEGKHIRFIYDSDDEIEGEEEVSPEEEQVSQEKHRVAGAVSPSVLCLKGLPQPEGKHLRFHEEEQED